MKNAMNSTVYLGFGSNLGDREGHFKKTLGALKETRGILVIRHSSLREYPPLGPPQPHYLNGVIEIQTSLAPEELLEQLHRIEASLGRTREAHWGPRTVDLDILFFGNMILDTANLKIPHPGACERRFVLQPLAELCPELVDPGSEKRISEILSTLGD